MKKAAAAAALVVLVLLGVAAGYFLYKRHQSRNIRGSSTEEFVTTEAAPPPKPRPEGIVWPMYGYDEQRVRAVTGFDLKPPFRKLWRFNGHALLEFPPAIAYGRLYFANNPGLLVALDEKTHRVKWRYRAHRCTAASPAVANGIVYETFLNTP